MSEISSSTTQLWILRHIAETAPREEVVWYITRLLDELGHHSPHGVLKFLVFEPMGLSVISIVEESPQSYPRMIDMEVCWPVSI